MPERTICARCRRPPVVCFCADVRSIATRTRVVLLQHPKERKVGVGTARLAHLALNNSILRVGMDFSADPVVRDALTTSNPICVLFPKPGALDVAELPHDRPVTLVVLDGTWSLARKLLRFNPGLASLPHVAFTPRRPSQYRIRKQPAEFCVSTIEALAEVLEIIEPDNGPFDRLLDPFLAMVARQERFANEIGARRHLRVTRPRRPSRRQILAARLSHEWERLVCVQGDANAWARRDPARQSPELVHWVAHRPATGETFQSIVAPRCPLAPGTPEQVELAADAIHGGESIEACQHRWRGFIRPNDVVVTWGTFYVGLAAADGVAPLPAPLDLRRETLGVLRAETSSAHTAVNSPDRLAMQQLRNHSTGRLRTVDACAAVLAVTSATLGLPGRAGRRLAALVGVVAALATGEGKRPKEVEEKVEENREEGKATSDNRYPLNNFSSSAQRA